MNYYIPFALITILLCFIYRQSEKNSSGVFVATMIIAFIFAAIRYEFGPDWFSYYNIFNELQSYGEQVYTDNMGHAEPLFIRYFSLFSSYTFFLAFNSLLWFGTYTVFFKKYVNEKYYWFVLLLLFFDINCILNNLVAMRQALTSFLFLIAFFILVRKGFSKISKLWFTIILVLCSLLHTSCFLLIPLALVNSSNKSLFFSKRYIVIVVVLAAISVFAGRYALTESIADLLIGNIEDFQRYETYLSSLERNSSGLVAILKLVISTVLSIIPLFFIIKHGSNESDPTQVVIYKFGIIIATVGCILGQGLLSRYMMILNPFYIASLVRACTVNKNRVYNIVVLSCAAFSSIYSFYYYLQADYCISFLTYQTVFSAPSIP